MSDDNYGRRRKLINFANKDVFRSEPTTCTTTCTTINCGLKITDAACRLIMYARKNMNALRASDPQFQNHFQGTKVNICINNSMHSPITFSCDHCISLACAGLNSNINPWVFFFFVVLHVYIVFPW